MIIENTPGKALNRMLAEASEKYISHANHAFYTRDEELVLRLLLSMSSQNPDEELIIRAETRNRILYRSTTILAGRPLVDIDYEKILSVVPYSHDQDRLLKVIYNGIRGLVKKPVASNLEWMLRRQNMMKSLSIVVARGEALSGAFMPIDAVNRIIKEFFNRASYSPGKVQSRIDEIARQIMSDYNHGPRREDIADHQL